MMKQDSNVFARLFILLTAILIAISAQAVTSTAADVIRKSADKLHNAPSVEATFTIAHGDKMSSGTMLLSGECFKLTTPELYTWFDGKTQWAYSPLAGEVNISEPTAEELQQINPFAIITAMQKKFTPRRLKTSPGSDKIELTPKSESDYLNIVAVFDSTTNMPKEIIITLSDRSVTTITINSIKQGGKPATGTFRFNKSNFPGVEIVDLR